MDKINIYFGSDTDFNKEVALIDEYNTIGDILNHIGKQEILLTGLERTVESPFDIENLIIHTDDYGCIKEWALLGFSNNILEHTKVAIKNLWLNNPPKTIYDDIKKSYPHIIYEHRTIYQDINLEMLKKISENYNSLIIGQDGVINQLLSSIYSLKNPKRKRPVTFLFLGESGVGKTETAKYISSVLNGEMVRIQFSMQQTNEAYQFIFGAEHGENSLARELIRRESNVILLDEFDKVHQSFYNAFYQMFDEGIFVDSNYSINLEKCIIICTTNYLNKEEAESKLGAPIYSRFSKIIKFHPISLNDKVKIAERNYNEFYGQLEPDDKELIVSNEVLAFYVQQISKGYYKNMRMLKNDIEDAINYEILKARGIL